MIAVADPFVAVLPTLGGALRARRRALRVSATAAAEAAGVSRVTLHRIEKGEPTVAMGAYVAAARALGLRLFVDDATATPARATEDIRLADHETLRRLAWHMPGRETVTPQEALELYERNWRHVDETTLSETERALIDLLTTRFGRGRLLV